ncbi:MAG: toxin-antitoxin system YwqK family antitoxin [Bacteroidota bacterium]
MTFVLILLVIVFFYSGCDVQSTRPENGIVREKGYNMNDNEPAIPLDMEYEYKNGEMVRYTQFYQNGNKKYEVLYSDSVSNRFGPGEFIIMEYYESGKPKVSSHTIADSIITKKEYYENGKTALEFYRTPGKKDKGVRYFADGKKQEEYEYRNEQRHGVWIEWDSLGKQIRYENYSNGKLLK